MTRLLRWIPLVLALLAPHVPRQTAVRPARHDAPRTLYPVVRVVDADTLHVLRDGRVETLRLASVDAEEKLAGSPSLSASKPETLFGSECAEWARAFFAGLAEDGEPPRVGLVFPAGEERRDAYGRLLSHVVLPDGTDFNLLLVETGRSPYFDKYGRSEILHDAFVAAQARARAARRGIWDPATNRPATPGAPSARRDYDRLLPWWRSRADAIEAFRSRAAAHPDAHASAEDPAALERALAACARDPRHEVEVFGEVHRVFDERDGGATVLFRTGDRRRAVRARFGRGELTEERREEIERSKGELRANHWSVTGRLRRNEERGGFEIDGGAARWRLRGAG